jgi:hypothetical protein
MIAHSASRKPAIPATGSKKICAAHACQQKINHHCYYPEGIFKNTKSAKMIEAYPLYWPANFPRSGRKTTGQFKTTLPGALKNVQNSLKLFSKDSGKQLSELVISSNVTLGSQNPKDPGVAVWFSWDGLQVCIPVDRYEKVEANLQAIHHIIIEARRTELRHGGLAIVRATFAGFKALPSSGRTKPWWEILGVNENSTADEITKAYKRKAAEVHPDKGGSTEAFQELNQALHAARLQTA